VKLYVITGPGGTKVGVANDPEARLKYFVRHERYRGLETLVRTWSLDGIEREVEYTACQIVPSDRAWGVEQFTIGPDDMVWWVEEAIRRVRSGRGVERPYLKIARREQAKKEGRTVREIVDLVKSDYKIRISQQTAWKYTRGKR
jgi:hypothetical protein